MFTSHILFSLENYKRVSPVGLLLLIWLLMRMRVGNDANLIRR